MRKGTDVATAAGGSGTDMEGVEVSVNEAVPPPLPSGPSDVMLDYIEKEKEYQARVDAYNFEELKAESIIRLRGTESGEHQIGY
jgi:hypothetical protein